MLPRKRDFQQNIKMLFNHESDQKARILQAIETIYSTIFLNIRAAVRAYDVPRSILTNRFRKQPTR